MSLDPVDHEAAALARLPEYLKDKPKLAALLAAYTAQANDLETALQELLLNRAIDTAEGVQLDAIGVIVGQERGGLEDDDYRRYLRARIATNKSNGTIPAILKVAGLVVGDTAVLTLYNDGAAAYTLHLGSTDGIGIDEDLAEVLLAFLKDATAGGVRPVLAYGASDADSTMIWGSAETPWGQDWAGSID